MPDTVLGPRIYIIDDDQEVLNSLTWLLESVNLKVKCYNSAIDFHNDYQTSTLGCIVTDVRMPMMSGLELFEELKFQKSCLPVIFLTGHGDIAMAVNAIKAGAAGFIAKPFNDQYLLDQIHNAIALNLKNRQAQTTLNLIDTLSKREKQVLELVIAGKLNKQIAAELCISRSTVEFHRARLMRKSGARNLAQLIKTYLREEQ